MEGRPTDFWGKLETAQDGTVIAWHPLAHHCADVAACAELLLRGTLLGPRLARLTGRTTLPESTLQRLCVLAALHDVGKYCVGFQAKARHIDAPTAGHVGTVVGLVGSPFEAAVRLNESLGVDDWASWGSDDALTSLFLASVCHHGKPVPTGHAPQPGAWDPRGSNALDPFAGIAALRDAVQRWYPAAFDSTGDTLPEDVPFHHAFSGLVMLADWLGSDRTVFPYSEHLNEERMPESRERARRLLANFGLLPQHARRGLGRKQIAFSCISDHAPRPLQQTVLGAELPEDAALWILEAETGSGKTEAALALFLRAFQAGSVDGLYFALPTRTAATQLHERIVRIIERSFPSESSRPPVTLAVPGYLRVDDLEGERRLEGFGVLWPDDDNERWRHRGWAAEHPKRYLAGAIVVGTVDQVLLSVLMVGHAHLRAFALLRHLVVIDEVHASDAYMTRLLEEVVNRVLAAGGNMLLMSATLGMRARARFMRAAGVSIDVDATNLEPALAEPYPVLARACRGRVERHGFAAVGHARRVSVDLESRATDPARVARAALDAAALGARVLVIRNTVADCVATQRAMEKNASEEEASLLFRCAGQPAPHHARFARVDRQALDQAIGHAFAGGARSGGGCVAIATQTVQQSLDLDADYMVSDLCPMDVLLQRAGRLHRHQRSRPRGFSDPRMTVLVPQGENLGCRFRADGRATGSHGMGTVYEDLRVLETTRRWIAARGEIRVPQDNRHAIEETTHPEVLSRLAAELGELWQRHAIHVEGGARASEAVARLNLLDWTVPFGDAGFPSGELERRIRTRLGEGDRLARLSGEPTGPFGESVGQMIIPSHMTRDAGPDAQAECLEQLPGGFRFKFGAAQYAYDRHGLDRESDG